MRPLDVNGGLINILCHPVEKSLFEYLRKNEQCRLFYRLFTRKEAYCKALGAGLQRARSGLRFIDFPASMAVQVYDEYINDISPFFVYDIDSITGYKCLLPHSKARLSLFDLKPPVAPFAHHSRQLSFSTIT